MPELAYYTTSQLARRLGVDPSTVRRHAAQGTIPAERTPGGHFRFPIDQSTSKTERGAK